MSKQPVRRWGHRLAPLISLPVSLGPLLSWPPPAAAQPSVYRSVDAQGRVSFSSTPPAGENLREVESIQLPPGPSEANRQAAEARARDIQQAVDAYAQERQAARKAATQPEASGKASGAAKSDNAQLNG
ncbi:DUF4124 domain-containing protein [Rhabdochromatium marinum]|uniref:DUF4124 domain-containing protein n=1 Tax=Rhabdochromatium marinum TaxID=48729 RepID=UPI001903EC79|nr:DUF4124 domain-containing protein [Rhabdochromatium marinum]MBK1649652.1 hypothetical protein [Rhabdochromatium marinum]